MNTLAGRHGYIERSNPLHRNRKPAAFQLRGKSAGRWGEFAHATLHGAPSASVARQLSDLGYKNFHPLYGGFDAWEKAGGPVENKK